MSRTVGPLAPASLFGVVVGLAGLASAWRAAVRLWAAPPAVGETIMLLAAVIWLALVVLYLLKWIVRREEATLELVDPVQSGFVALVPLTTLLMGLALAPYSRAGALALLIAGSAGQLGLGAYISGKIWQGELAPAHATPVLYLPGVGANFVAATLCGALGYPDWGALFFGAGAIAWVVLESIIYQRPGVGPPLPVAARSALGIQLAPPVVGAAAYLSITSGMADMVAQTMFGYGLLQALLLLRLWPWLAENAFGPGAWAFTFGVTSLAVVPMRLIERGGFPAAEYLAPPLFVFANLFILVLTIRTVRLALNGELFPPSLALGPRGERSS